MIVLDHTALMCYLTSLELLLVVFHIFIVPTINISRRMKTLGFPVIVICYASTGAFCI